MTPIRDPMQRRLIVALDVETLAEARRMVRLLAPHVQCFKIGKQLFVAAGPDVVRVVHRAGRDVFLDLKFHDIPNTVAAAVIEAARLGVRFVDLHASGGPEMMRAARARLVRVCRAERLRRPVLLAVTVLTSLDARDLAAVGVPATPARQVRRLARLAAASGMDGIVCSPHEIAPLRRTLGRRLTIVTPGVRPPGAEAADQKRVLTPGQAIAAGADFLVIGRPILQSADPPAAVRAMAADMRRAARLS
ncbi:MAG TPA: orotidine-5'-phosphate decarboxylase [Candidatus Limnocylindria bacterium]|nr:orotidine-5'-phosphate decarboxylase [Candidatus Limnocylindria bacterium]